MKRIFFRISKYNVLLVLAAILFMLTSVSVAQASSCIEVTKFCRNASGPGTPIEFWGEVSNCAFSVDLWEVTVDDDHAGLVLEIPHLPVGASEAYGGSYIPIISPSTNVVTARGVTQSTVVYTDTADATCIIEGDACIEVTKFCRNASGSGTPIEFWGTVTNCAERDLFDVTVDDDHAGLVLEIPNLPVGASENYSGSYIPIISPSTNVVTARGVTSSNLVRTDTADATCIIEGDGGEGCTPGFWKNHMGCVKQNCPQGNWDAWAATGYSPDDDFDTTFGVDLFDPDITLGDAIWAKGGGVNKLARHGTAALLSSAHPGVDYELSIAEVIIAVQNGDSELLVGYNESGCPL
jgi:hypothetical protein